MDQMVPTSISGPGQPGAPAAVGTSERPGYRIDARYPLGVRDREAGT